MNKMVSTISRFSSGKLFPIFYCIDDSGEVIRALTQTLFQFIEEHATRDYSALEALINTSEAGAYTPADPDLPDWSVNDKNVWLTPPMALPGHIAISNEYSGDYAVTEGGEAQQFTYTQFRAALKHWREFLALVERDGKEHWVGRRYEARFPD